MRVSIYARYSSDKQREASIDDQVRLCEERAAREGWRVVKRYTDHAISGASLIRPGIQALMHAPQTGQFDVVLTESLDRVSRDQEDRRGLQASALCRRKDSHIVRGRDRRTPHR